MNVSGPMSKASLQNEWLCRPITMKEHYIKQLDARLVFISRDETEIGYLNQRGKLIIMKFR